MTRVLTFLFALLALAAATMPAYAGFRTGEVLGHGLSVCFDKQDAIAVVEAERRSHEAAGQAFEDAATCWNLPVRGPKVGKVVHRAKNASAVEIVNEAGEVLGYFVTTQPVNVDSES